MKPKILTYAQLHQIARNSRPLKERSSRLKKAPRPDFEHIALLAAGVISLTIAILVRF